jgi:hypothetical protein
MNNYIDSNSNINLFICQECANSYWCEQDLEECENENIEDNFYWKEMSYRKYIEVTLQWHHSELGDI